MIRRLTLGVLLLLLVGVPAALAAGPPGTEQTTTPIKHFVMLLQENHSFDNYFGTYPGADGIPKGTCIPDNPARPQGHCVEPFHLGGRAVSDPGHSKLVFDQQYHGGKMDGFVASGAETGGFHGISMGYYDDRDIPFYWNVADNYVLFDRFFTSANAGSTGNHIFWVTGSSGHLKGESLPSGGLRLPTIFDRLEKRGVSWKFYVQNYDPRISFRNANQPGIGDRASQVVWVPLLAMPRYLDTPSLRSHIVDLNEFYKDLANGTLPAVAYIAPAGASEHPPGTPREGQRFVRTLVNSMMRSTSWPTSAFMWAYDDWGGWYDHVRPPAVDADGYGFRAPALLVSPYARKGFIDHTTLDFTSALKFIEQNWSVPPLASRDKAAKSFAGAFDFTQPPRQAVILPGQRHEQTIKPPKPLIVYITYGIAGTFAAGLLLWAARGRRRGRGVRYVGPDEGGS